MTYTKLFDPAGQQAFDASRAYRLGDQTEKPRYVYDDPDIVLAVNVALAAGRPLLVRGKPGTGKSSLARSVAEILKWRFYAITVSSRTAARDLLWTFDTVARLADAQAGPAQIRHRRQYVSPGVLWWAFKRDSAFLRGLTPEEATEIEGFEEAVDPCTTGDPLRAVVLIDEIDKADPDVPNDLLLPLGSFRFDIEDGREVVATQPPLVIVTTNEERDLPRAFLRRCVILALEPPQRLRLEAIVRSHFPAVGHDLLAGLLDAYERVGDDRAKRDQQLPSVAELIDAVAACINLGTSGPPSDADWPRFETLLLDKVTRPPEGV